MVVFPWKPDVNVSVNYLSLFTYSCNYCVVQVLIRRWRGVVLDALSIEAKWIGDFLNEG